MIQKKFKNFKPELLIESCGGSITSCGGSSEPKRNITSCGGTITSCGGSKPKKSNITSCGGNITSCGGGNSSDEEYVSPAERRRIKRNIKFNKIFDETNCTNCDTKLVDGALFCHSCGKKQ